ncbi:hypothetical protein C7444_10557 [Sphaerotilus hippei]|uniref:DUF2946 family protein n=1 Tax=Sphaerotilus hippei TaxID=744406 RepID=A0A318H618_9BURK|nr:hypothetical protein [Sphaerotilus hippei]PXW96960.1 hypothetical protein C7444_10557 [Sphaerotilus hippei]
MRTLPRPTLHWLLWLVIALLPLRGWTLTQMSLPAGAPLTVVAHASDHAGLPADATPAPCHTTDRHDEVPEAAAAGHGSCSLCDVCHASLGLAAPVELNLAPLPEAAPCAATPLGLPDGPPSEPFRPPRPLT